MKVEGRPEMECNSCKKKMNYCPHCRSSTLQIAYDMVAMANR